LDGLLLFSSTYFILLCTFHLKTFSGEARFSRSRSPMFSN
jgi:hypothetical protein